MHYIIICNLPPGYLVQLLLGHHTFHELNSCMKISVKKQMEVQKVDTENYRPKHFNNVYESSQATTSFCLNDF